MNRKRKVRVLRARRQAARSFWIGLGGFSFILGMIGVLLPVMPTTPFILLAAFAFSRGSPTLQAALEGHRRFGPVIRDWKQNGAIARRHKILAVSMMAASLAFSTWLGLDAPVLAIQAVCMGGAALFVLTRPDGAA